MTLMCEYCGAPVFVGDHMLRLGVAPCCKACLWKPAVLAVLCLAVSLPTLIWAAWVVLG